MKFLGTTTVIAPIVLIILTIWMAFAFASPASASPLPDKYYRDEMPTAYRGAWCQTPKPNVMKKCSGPRDEGDFVINAKGFVTSESVCERVKIIVVDLNPRHLEVKFRCALMEEMANGKTDVWGAESGWMFTSDIRLDGSTLTMKDE